MNDSHRGRFLLAPLRRGARCTLVIGAIASAAAAVGAEPAGFAAKALHVSVPLNLAQPNPPLLAQSAPAAAPAARAAKPRAAPLSEAAALAEAEQQAEVFYEAMLGELMLRERQFGEAYAAFMAAARKSGNALLYRRAAEAAWRAQQWREALQATRLWVEGAPDDGDGPRLLAQMYATLGRPQEAVPFLQRDLARQPQASVGAALLSMQRLLATAADKAAALAAVRQLVEPYAALPEAALALAQAAFAAGELELGWTQLERALQLRPGFTAAAMLAYGRFDPRAELGSVAAAESMKAHRLLLRYVDAIESADGVALDYLRRLAAWRAVDGRLLALEQAERLARRLPEVPELWLLLAGLRDAGKEALAAGMNYQRALELAKAQASQANLGAERERLLTIQDAALLGLASLAEQRRDLPAALALIEQIFRGDMRAEARLRLSNSAMRLKDYAFAERLIAAMPDDTRDAARMKAQARAHLLREQGRLGEAAQVYEDAIAALPDEPELIYDAALLAERRGDVARMEAKLKRVIELKPDFAHAYNALGYSLADRNLRLPEAKRLIEQALQLTPDDPLIIDSLGWVLYRMGQTEAAARELRRAFSMRPDAEIAAHLGEVLWELGQRDEAQKVWQEGYRLDAENEALKQTLKRYGVRVGR
jgi:tetratricopeptide (TPR) repeat protein